jgi:hypothetical protein
MRFYVTRIKKTNNNDLGITVDFVINPGMAVSFVCTVGVCREVGYFMFTNPSKHVTAQPVNLCLTN